MSGGDRPIGRLNLDVAAEARESAGRATAERRRVNYRPTVQSVDTSPRLCKCGDRAWDDGTGDCIRCGRAIPLLRAL